VTGSGKLLPMLLTTVVAQSAEESAELPADPMVFGVSAFAILCALLVGVLVFGKGRPHS
jgi:hypothetical protein